MLLTMLPNLKFVCLCLRKLIVGLFAEISYNFITDQAKYYSEILRFWHEMLERNCHLLLEISSQDCMVYILANIFKRI